jgi:hypothetical protein
LHTQSSFKTAEIMVVEAQCNEIVDIESIDV